jgi:hypothetical protein
VGSHGYGKRKYPRRPGAVAAAHLPQTLGRVFIDSGAFSLYNLHASGRPKSSRFQWYWTGAKFTPEFRKYLDDYAAFIEEWKDGIDFYVNVDAIYNPELSWAALKYLEQRHGLNPVPVFHDGEPLRWLDKHLDAGYHYIGVSGLGPEESTRASYERWADGVFRLLCPPPHFRPIVRTHGFAMTSHRLMWRYPWWSVDSVSWARYAGYGWVLVPPRRGGEFVYDAPPHVLGFSHMSSARTKWGKHVETLTPGNRRLLFDWLDEAGVARGSVHDNDDPPKGVVKGQTKVYGVCSEYNARAAVNLIFYDRMAKARGPWARGFRVPDHGELDGDEYAPRDAPPLTGTGPMKIFYSGGSEIVETTLRKPCVMISAYTHAKNWKPNSRLRNLMNMRKEAGGKV